MAVATPLRTPPGPKGTPFIGSIPEISAKGLVNFYYELWQNYGDLVQMRLGPMKSYLFSRPEHIQHILVKNPDKYIKGASHDRLRNALGLGLLTSEGEVWSQKRKLMQPTYTPVNVRKFAALMTEEAQTLVARWQTYEAGTAVDINAEMVRMTMSVISRSIFGVDVDAHYREIGLAFRQFLEYAASSTNRLIEAPLFVPTPKNQRLKKAKKLVHDFIFEIIRQRREEGLQDDLLSMLMSARDENTGQTMSDEQLHDEILITLFAGHETTASLLSWTWFLLAQHPEVEAKLHAELESTLAGRTPGLDDIPNLRYTRMVLDETLRLYSPVIITARDLAVDDQVDGYRIPQGSMAVIFPYATHRHPEFWARPLEFYPEHFTETQVAARPRYAYYPFGAGQRICIGSHFALMEAVLLLAEIAQRHQPRLALPNDGQIEFVGVLRPAEPILMTVNPR